MAVRCAGSSGWRGRPSNRFEEEGEAFVAAHMHEHDFFIELGGDPRIPEPFAVSSEILLGKSRMFWEARSMIRGKFARQSLPLPLMVNFRSFSLFYNYMCRKSAERSAELAALDPASVCIILVIAKVFQCPREIREVQSFLDRPRADGGERPLREMTHGDPRGMAFMSSFVSVIAQCRVNERFVDLFIGARARVIAVGTELWSFDAALVGAFGKYLKKQDPERVISTIARESLVTWANFARTPFGDVFIRADRKVARSAPWGVIR
jgi:hypothetical protein